MTTYSRWDIVLVPFPFTDLATAKRRPALVVSPDDFNRGGPDVVIAFLTSQVHVAPRSCDHLLRLWRECGLPKPTLLRMKFATVEQAIVIKKLGRLPEAEREEVRRLLERFFVVS